MTDNCVATLNFRTKKSHQRNKSTQSVSLCTRKDPRGSHSVPLGPFCLTALLILKTCLVLELSTQVAQGGMEYISVRTRPPLFAALCESCRGARLLARLRDSTTDILEMRVKLTYPDTTRAAPCMVLSLMDKIGSVFDHELSEAWWLE